MVTHHWDCSSKVFKKKKSLKIKCGYSSWKLFIKGSTIPCDSSASQNNALTPCRHQGKAAPPRVKWQAWSRKSWLTLAGRSPQRATSLPQDPAVAPRAPRALQGRLSDAATPQERHHRRLCWATCLAPCRQRLTPTLQVRMETSPVRVR